MGHFHIGIVLQCFARRVPIWSLPMPGHVACLVCAGVGPAGDGEGKEVHWVSGSCPGSERIRLNRKNPCTPRW